MERCMKAQTNLPSEPAALIGRTQDLAMLDKWIQREGRLATIWGPGGCGKTRLATRFGWQQLRSGRFSGGVWFCDLSTAQSIDDVLRVLERTLGLEALTESSISRD